MTKTIKISIETGNEAFEGNEGYEAARILREAADRLMRLDNLADVDPFKLHDCNGNPVGSVTVELDC